MSNHYCRRVRAFPRGALTLCAIAGLLGSRIASACDLPPLVVVPDANAFAGRQPEIFADVQRYHRAMTAYTDCIREEIKAAGGDAMPERTKKLFVDRFNSAVAEVQTVLKLYEKNAGKPSAPAGPPHRFDNGGLDSAFPQFPTGGTTSSGQPRPPGN